MVWGVKERPWGGGRAGRPPPPPPPACQTSPVHVAEDALYYTSITILCIFAAELLVRLVVFGLRYYTHNW